MVGLYNIIEYTIIQIYCLLLIAYCDMLDNSYKLYLKSLIFLNKFNTINVIPK